MQEQLGLNIVLFKIKNTDFDFTPYGLTDRYFRIDVTDNINASKSIKFTEYPLIDGTTRIEDSFSFFIVFSHERLVQ